MDKMLVWYLLQLFTPASFGSPNVTEYVLRYTERIPSIEPDTEMPEWEGSEPTHFYCLLGDLTDIELQQLRQRLAEYAQEICLPVETDPDWEDSTSQFMQIINLALFDEDGPYAQERLACLRSDAELREQVRSNFFPEYDRERYWYQREAVLCSGLLRSGKDETCPEPASYSRRRATKNDGTEIELDDPGVGETCYICYYLDRMSMKDIRKILREHHDGEPDSDPSIQQHARKYAEKHDLNFDVRQKGRPSQK